MDQVKRELAKIVRFTLKVQLYELRKNNNRYFYNLEKKKHKKKHITSLTKEDGKIVHEPKQILEGKGFFSKKFIKLKICVHNLPISSTFLTA